MKLKEVQQILSITANQTYFTQHTREGSILNQELFISLKGDFLFLLLVCLGFHGLTLPCWSRPWSNF